MNDINKKICYNICKSPAYAFLQKYYARLNCGFDLADYLIRYLKNTGYSGDLQPMKDAVEKVDSVWHLNGSSVNYGY